MHTQLQAADARLRSRLIARLTRPALGSTRE
jgi:hypothetical protein